MKIAVWRTGHEIADTVALAINQGLPNSSLPSTQYLDEKYDLNTAIEMYDIHIGYGILRNMDKVYRAAQAAGKPFICLDKGYWKPGHFDGYYRISLNSTQQTTCLDKLEPDYERWDRLGIKILPFKERRGNNLVVPPTDYVQSFFGLSSMPQPWPGDPIYIRYKTATNPLQEDLDHAARVITFNSSVGWEALRQGIPVVSDEQHSIVGAYQKLVDKDISKDYEAIRRLFGIMAATQLRLDEIKQGLLCPLLIKLLAANH